MITKERPPVKQTKKENLRTILGRIGFIGAHVTTIDSETDGPFVVRYSTTGEAHRVNMQTVLSNLSNIIPLVSVNPKEVGETENISDISLGRTLSKAIESEVSVENYSK